MTDRYPPLAPEAMTPEQRAVADEIAGGPRGGLRGPFIALLHNPALARRVQALGEHLRFGTTFDNVLVEVAVLVTARRWSCQYEWFAHERLARQAGVSDAIISAVARNQRPVGMTTDESLVHDFCVSVTRAGAPTSAQFDAVRDRFGAPAALDLIALCGYYTLLAMVLNTADPALPAGTPPPLAPASATAFLPDPAG